jgi:hypothetical protein
MSWSRATRCLCCHLIALRARQRSERKPLASRRSTAALAKTVTPWLNPGPRFLELPGANGRTLPGASAASTSQTGRSAGRYDARSRPGAVCETARGDRTRCRNRIASGMHPSRASFAHVTISVTKVNKNETKIFCSLRSKRVPVRKTRGRPGRKSLEGACA